MLAYLLKRLLLMLPTLLGALTLTFVVIQFVPGGPVELLLAEAGESTGGGSEGYYSASRDSDPQQVQALRKLYGFDKPTLERYVDMLWQFARLDLGRSFQHNKTVWALIVEKLPVSISLGLWSMLLAYAISVPLGIAKAVREGQRFDVVTSVLVLIGYAIPGFVLGVLLIVLFAGGSFWELFPLRGLTSDGWSEMSWPQRIVDYLWHLTLPLVCMTAGAFAVTTMLTKNAFIEEIRKQYVLVALAKGLSERAVLWRHVLRNAMIPLVTGFPAAFIGAFFAGSVLIETLFSLDGLGLLAYESVVRRDYPVVMGSLYLFTLMGLAVKLVADVLYVVVDPRVQFGAVQR